MRLWDYIKYIAKCRNKWEIFKWFYNKKRNMLFWFNCKNEFNFFILWCDKNCVLFVQMNMFSTKFVSRGNWKNLFDSKFLIKVTIILTSVWKNILLIYNFTLLFAIYFYTFLITFIKFYYMFNKMLNTSIMISYRLMIKRPWVYTKKEERQ